MIKMTDPSRNKYMYDSFYLYEAPVRGCGLRSVASLLGSRIASLRFRLRVLYIGRTGTNKKYSSQGGRRKGKVPVLFLKENRRLEPPLSPPSCAEGGTRRGRRRSPLPPLPPVSDDVPFYG